MSLLGLEARPVGLGHRAGLEDQVECALAVDRLADDVGVAACRATSSIRCSSPQRQEKSPPLSQGAGGTTKVSSSEATARTARSVSAATRSEKAISSSIVSSEDGVKLFSHSSFFSASVASMPWKVRTQPLSTTVTCLSSAATDSSLAAGALRACSSVRLCRARRMPPRWASRYARSAPRSSPRASA